MTVWEFMLSLVSIKLIKQKDLIHFNSLHADRMHTVYNLILKGCMCVELSS